MIYPKQIIIETTSRCNLKCKYCPSLTQDNDAKGDMSMSLFNTILARIARNHSDDPKFRPTIIPWMNGEPLLHPRYTEMVQNLLQRKFPFYITTNGTIWNEKLFEAITEEDSSCYQLIFSLDGMFYDTIKGARPGTNVEKVKQTIHNAIQMKKRKTSKIDLAVKICHRGQDYQEIENYIKHWLDIPEISYVCVGKALTEKNETQMRHYPCQYFDNNFMVIRHDGTLVLCAYNNEIVNENAVSLGKIQNFNSILDAYNNIKYQKQRVLQAIGKYNDVCSKCGFAYTGSGMTGTVKLLDGDGKKLYYHSDYYNQFFSYKKKQKKSSYYGWKK